MGELGVMTAYKDVRRLSVGAALERSAHLVPGKTCVFFNEETLTYRQLNDRSAAVAAGLQAMGLQKGDRVAVYTFNRLKDRKTGPIKHLSFIVEPDIVADLHLHILIPRFFSHS